VAYKVKRNLLQLWSSTRILLPKLMQWHKTDEIVCFGNSIHAAKVYQASLNLYRGSFSN